MYSLFLYEKASSGSVLSNDKLQDYLKNIQLISIQNPTQVGKEFLSHINFMGCSPLLYEDAPHSITLQIFKKKRFIGGESIHSLVCPHCKTKLNTEAIDLSVTHYNCNSCNNTYALDTINWRKSAAKSKLFIQISNIFPKEAQPNNHLLTSLASLTQTPWDYFYSKTIDW